MITEFSCSSITSLSHTSRPFISRLPPTCWPLAQSAAEILLWRESQGGGMEHKAGEVGWLGDLWWFLEMSGRFPAASLAHCHAAKCPKLLRHVLPFNQRMKRWWWEGVAQGELGKMFKWVRGAWRHHWANRSFWNVWSGMVKGLWRGAGFLHSARKGRKRSFKHWHSKSVLVLARRGEVQGWSPLDNFKTSWMILTLKE